MKDQTFFQDRLDTRLLINSSIYKYHKNTRLDEDLSKFSHWKYLIYDLDCTNWNSKNAHPHLKEGLDFPDYYGMNLNAFNDCLGDMRLPQYLGLVIAFRRFDLFYEEDKGFAQAVLDIIAHQSREWLIYGKRLFGFLQSQDPFLELEKVGAHLPPWNDEEWFDKDRI